MKILLIGDFSSFHVNLKSGLNQIGEECYLASDGDGFKKTGISDIYFPFDSNKFRRYTKKILFPFTNLKSYFNYDVVQLVYNDIFGGSKFNYNYYIIKKIVKNNKKVFLSACGSDYFSYINRKNLEYNFFDDDPTVFKNGKCVFEEKYYKRNNEKVLELIDGIIPTTYTYAEAYRNHPKLLNTIPFPMDIDKIKYIPQKIKNNKIKIFHGLNREGFKGTKYIREAMEKIKEKYPKDVDIIIDGKMPLGKYLKVLEEANIVVDQAYSYGYGMNALYSLAMGKVVLSGNEPECGKEFGRDDIPVINIKPSVEDIYNKLEKLVLNKKSVEEIGYKSRKFVEDFHDYKKVAKQYLETWEKCGDNN